MAKVAVIDLFCGAGGFSVAARSAGHDVRLSIEVDRLCCDTLMLNRRWHQGEILNADIATVSGVELRKRIGISRRDPLLVVGGAPCQPFSKAAYWTDPGADARYRRAKAKGEKAERPQAPPTKPDARRNLVQEFWRIVFETAADGFVFENVPSILHPRNKSQLEKLQRSAARNGYQLSLVVANAVQFGVAQSRSRVFLLGAKRSRPELPSLSSSVTPKAGDAISSFSGKEFHEPEEVIEGRWAEHLRFVPPGWNYKAHTAWAGHPNPTFETETRFWNFLLKLDPNRPSWTIAANPGPWTGPFHWDSRRLRTPELAALQGFPKKYAFAGSRRERVRQIGNAVPPPMAAGMIELVASAMTGKSQKPRVGR